MAYVLYFSWTVGSTIFIPIAGVESSPRLSEQIMALAVPVEHPQWQEKKSNAYLQRRYSSPLTVWICLGNGKALTKWKQNQFHEVFWNRLEVHTGIP